MGGVQVRKFNPVTDTKKIEEVEKKCEVNSDAKLSIFTDLLGDPICRIRHFPFFLMLVAEVEENGVVEVVGMVRGCIKTITCGRKLNKFGSPPHLPLYTKVAYILGLRVSPSHRRRGIGRKLVEKMEEWIKENEVEYSYIATEKDNIASMGLFVGACGYTRFRTGSILVQPVFAHRVRVSSRTAILELDQKEAERLYRRRFAAVEFFPRDIDAVLGNRLHLGTYVAVPAGYGSRSWPGSDLFLDRPPESWAVLSVWNTRELFRLQVKGGSFMQRAIGKMSRVVDRALPSLRIPSIPEVFRPFGFHLLYGLGGEGRQASAFMTSLCKHAHNLARSAGCALLVTEVSCQDPVADGVPHWKSLSCDEDLWCVKRLFEGYSDGPVGDWTKSSPSPSIFLDPREF